jgi:hypothetical protein
MTKSKPSTVVKFGELPPSDRATKRKEDSNQAIADELRARPGEWALVLQADTNVHAWQKASNIKRGILAAFRPFGAFEATTRNGLDVWARYVDGAK